jgi:hypothetical protein
MLPDISGDEVEAYLIKEGLAQLNPAPAGVPTNSACTDAEHVAMQTGQQIKFHA